MTKLNKVNSCEVHDDGDVSCE